MDTPSPQTITRLIEAAQVGDTNSRDRLYAMLYADLCRIARAHATRSGTMSLDPPAIVHESVLRIERAARPGDFPSRRQFLGYAATVMRSVIVDYVRERQAAKRGGGELEVTLDTGLLDLVPSEAGVLDVHEALLALAEVDARCHRVVEMRYFGGLTEEEIASVLGVSAATVKRDWRKARAFLFDHFRDQR